MDTTLSDPLVDRLLDARYRVESRIARGGMSSVYLATDVRLDRRVAVKVMNPALGEDPGFVARFNREAQAAASLSHPDVVSVYDQGNDDGHMFLVMEYVAGVTLRDLLRSRGRLPAGEAVAVMDHVLAALGAAHRAGLVHRDIKPENVLVTPDGRVKVADFGLARAVAGTTLTTDDNLFLGTAAYLAPEQVRANVADARSDVYSAGVLLFELLTGATPFAGESPYAVAARRMDTDVPPPSRLAADVPTELDAVVLHATARDPDARPADAGAFHAELLGARDRLGLHPVVPAALGGETTTVLDRAAMAPTTAAAGTSVLPPAPPPPAARRRRRRWPWVVAALLLLAIAGGVTGWYFAVGRYTHAPDVLYEDKAAAINELKDAGLHWKISPVFSTSVDRGAIARQDPAAGARVRDGATVKLFISQGPQQRQLPDVAGTALTKATAALKAKGFTVSPRPIRQFSSSVPADHVISTNPGPGTYDVGTTVTLVVSRGPAPVTVPDVRGKDLATAKEILNAAGFAVRSDEVFSDTVPNGQVVGTDPAQGATAHDGDTVTVHVSKGPQLVAVPDVTGMKVDDGISALQQLGLQANVNRPLPFGPGIVRRQDPGAGTKVRPGSTITLDVY
jgi:beta-lactam-binding protein with PASTA domain/tRNA A-37 threonylcarbamoyl transferase component Bud32